jgi:hypothetical protein
MARDPRVYGGETKDFVDWIRTTGPTSVQQVQPIVLTNRWSQPNSLNGVKSKSNLVPREADVRDNTTDDLMDFIRSGPPQEANGDRRIPPTVAPVRSTMNGANPAPTVNGTPQHSLLSRPSVTDSFTSSGPLLNKNKPLPQTSGRNQGPPNPPTRTRRRPKDPYAIDDSDDEDEFTALPDRSNFSRTGNDTENLQDFLRSTSPPATNGPAALRSQANGSAAPQPLVSRAPTNGIIGRQAPPIRGPGAANPAANGAVPASLSNHTSHPQLNGAPSSRRINRPEARAAGATKEFNGHGYYYSTNDMADFLRSSGPDSLNGSSLNRNQGSVASKASVDVERTPSGSKRGKPFWKRSVVAGA